MSVSEDRWTCPSCSRTVVINGSPADVACAIAACQKRHADGHRAARDVLARLGLTEPDVRHRRHGKKAA